MAFLGVGSPPPTVALTLFLAIVFNVIRMSQSIVAVIVRRFCQPARLCISLVGTVIRVTIQLAFTPKMAALLLANRTAAKTLVRVLGPGIETAAAMRASAAQFVLLDPL
jgi:hypothetical protein